MYLANVINIYRNMLTYSKRKYVYLKFAVSAPT